MTTLRILLAAALLPLAACSVSTDDLKPLARGSCGAGFKECGYKCVSTSDPATGCGSASCQPCAGAAATCSPDPVPACATTACSGTQALCGGVCKDLANDAGHCGACDHWCESGLSCLGGTCDLSSMAAGNSARGLLFHGGLLYWVDDGNGGRLMSWDPQKPFSFGYANEVAFSLDTRAGAPNVFRIAAAPAVDKIFAVGWWAGESFTVWVHDVGAPVGVTEAFGAAPSANNPTVDGLAVLSDGSVFVSRTDSVPPWVWDATAGTFAVAASATPEAIHGFAALDRQVYYGWGAAGGTLVKSDVAGNEVVMKTGAGGAPHRLAVHAGAPVEYAWISELDGSVWRWLADGTSAPEPLRAATGTPTKADIAADADGIYWTDRAAGEVWEWRRADGLVFPLARYIAPNGVAADASFVYFTEDSGWVLRVPK